MCFYDEDFDSFLTLSTCYPCQCQDANDKPYNLIGTNMIPSPDECAEFCHKLPSPYLVGFEYGAYKFQGSCGCLYSGQNLPTPPSGFSVEIRNTDIGFGPIRGTDVLPGFDCYAFVQVRWVLALCTLIRKSSRYINSLYFLFLI